MNYVQIIDAPKKGKLAIIPLDEYKRLRALEKLEEKEDERDIRVAKAIMARVKAGKEPLIPAEVVDMTVFGGMHHIRAWRKYRGLTAEKLAKKAKIARAYLTQIETGKRKGTVAVYRALAKALGVSVEHLID